MKHILNERTLPRFVKYGVNVFGIDANLPGMEIAEKAIDATYKFFESINIPMHLKDVGIDESRIGEMARHIAENEGLENAWAPLKEKDITEILEAMMQSAESGTCIRMRTTCERPEPLKPGCALDEI